MSTVSQTNYWADPTIRWLSGFIDGDSDRMKQFLGLMRSDLTERIGAQEATRKIAHYKTVSDTAILRCRDTTGHDTRMFIRVVGLLHDLFEDFPPDKFSEWIKRFEIPDKIISRLNALTRRDRQDYFHYVRLCAEDVVTYWVKLADLEVNMRMCSISEIDETAIRRLRKYHKASRILEPNEDYWAACR